MSRKQRVMRRVLRCFSAKLRSSSNLLQLYRSTPASTNVCELSASAAFSTLSGQTQSSIRRPKVRLSEIAPSSYDALKLVWHDGTAREFKNVWLRDQCRCPECVHPSTKQKIADAAAIPLDIAPVQVTLSDVGELKITWNNENHRSVYDSDRLRERALENFLSPPRKRPKLWRTDVRVESLPTAHYDGIMESDVDLMKWLSGFRDYGLAIAKDVPLVQDAIVAVANRLAYVKETPLGRTFDVVAYPDEETTDLAYTSRPLRLHTDLNFMDPSPGVQMLHCIESHGPPDQAMSVLVDGFAAAEWLNRNRPAAFHVLTSLPVGFEIDIDGINYSNRVPVICTDCDGNLESIHVSFLTLNTWDVPDRLIRPFFSAHKTFVEKLNDGSAEVRVRLKAGDLVLMNNQRTLHGRTAFNSSEMKRYLQGCYLDLDSVLARLRSLEVKLGDETAIRN